MTIRFRVLLAVSIAVIWTCVAQVRAADEGSKPQQHQHVAAAEHHAASGAVDSAVCVLWPVGNSGVTGTVSFTRHGKVVHIRGEIRGLTPGKHGFHVHEYGDLTSMNDGMSLGGHFNPTHKPHGRPTDQQRHEGDFGNVVANESGVATIDAEDPVVELNGPHSIIGRGLVVHAKEDKFTQPVGDAGARVAVGVIGVAKPAK